MASSRVNIATMIELTFLVLAVYFSPTVSMKERVDHGTLLELSDLISNLEKRLSDSNFDSHLFDKLKSPSSESSDARSSKDESSLTSLGESHEDRREICMQKVTEGSIIRATDSLDAGAEFVDSFKSTESNLKCQDYCCKNTSCDVAVYQDKGDRYCYLFHCQGKCLFKNHVGYLVNSVTRSAAPSANDQSRDSTEEDTSGNESDLENLSGGKTGGGDESSSSESSNGEGDSREVKRPKEDAPSGGGETDSKNRRPEVVSAPIKEEHTGPVISQHSVSLSGYCTRDIQCEDTNAACISNNCRCRSGFYDKEGLCRTVCPSSKFECFELGTISRGPECVPKTQVCDSYMQCADGSDEFNCEATKDLPSLPRHGKIKPEHTAQGQFSKHKPENVKSSIPTVLSPIKSSAAPQDDGKFKHQEFNPKSSTKNKPSTPEPPSVGKNNTTTPRPLIGNTKSPSHKSENSDNSGPKHLFVSSLSREKVIIASPGGGNAEGPIVALSLGLALTLVLLVMVACRLRGFKHRLSKGRPLNQNEADYLINGMYL